MPSGSPTSTEMSTEGAASDLPEPEAVLDIQWLVEVQRAANGLDRLLVARRGTAILAAGDHQRGHVAGEDTHHGEDDDRDSHEQGDHQHDAAQDVRAQLLLSSASPVLDADTMARGKGAAPLRLAEGEEIT